MLLSLDYVGGVRSTLRRKIGVDDLQETILVAADPK